jgi:hypothetical protein
MLIGDDWRNETAANLDSNTAMLELQQKTVTEQMSPTSAAGLDQEHVSAGVVGTCCRCCSGLKSIG